MATLTPKQALAINDQPCTLASLYLVEPYAEIEGSLWSILRDAADGDLTNWQPMRLTWEENGARQSATIVPAEDRA